MSVVNEPIGNAAAMREALIAVSKAFDDSLICTDSQMSMGECDRLDDVYHKVKTALSEPPRNCDVGTAKEQTGRFLKFCDIHDCESDCPLFKANSCELAWAQMPYEAEEGDAS